jgi:uncharacterized protein Veg
VHKISQYAQFMQRICKQTDRRFLAPIPRPLWQFTCKAAILFLQLLQLTRLQKEVVTIIMEMLKPVHAVQRIRTQLEEMAGELVCVRANMGRSKILERTGRVAQTHPALFVLDVFEKRNRRSRASYQYIDVLTGTVEVLHPDSKEPLFPWIELLA